MGVSLKNVYLCNGAVKFQEICTFIHAWSTIILPRTRRVLENGAKKENITHDKQNARPVYGGCGQNDAKCIGSSGVNKFFARRKILQILRRIRTFSPANVVYSVASK